MLMGHSEKTDKAKFMNDIAQNVPVVEVFTEKSACLVDGMGIVQKLDGNQKTFGDIAKTVLKIVIREGDKCDRVDVVFDVYREDSIKDAERVNRGSGSGVKFRILATGHKVKQRRSFLSEAQNKTMLIEFITEEWKSNESKSMIGQKHYSSHVVRSVGALVRWERPLSMICSPLKKRQTHGFFCMQSMHLTKDIRQT